ncbi:MAG: TMEM165/GDT1 family protein [Thermodesulfovibrionales bacterium]|nr:TMEM165/GDT1 family protein [Thermodesulfovibrionales bacterium]
MSSFFTSLFFVILAEIGDRTQLLAICFATRYNWTTVIWGVFWATAVNHLLAVALGNYLTYLFPMNYIKIASSVGFIIFGLWTLRGDEISCDTQQRFKLNPFWTVFIAFFIAETGDKTQLATIALAADFNTFFPVWLGTTLGMVIANAFGIIAGLLMGKRIPARFIKWVAAFIFIVFGLLSLYDSVPSHFQKIPYIILALLFTGALIYAVNYLNRKKALR